MKRDLRLTQRFLRLAQDAALVRRVAYHEELTGLLSRSLLLDRFKQAVAQAARKGRQIALLFLDLDRFKNVNDTLAHAAGDDVLRQVAGRLAAGIRACDTACRYGGDEFVIMLPEANGRESTAAAAETIRSLLAAPYAVEGGRLTLTASIGTAVYPVDGRKLNDLARRCDIGMYRAKARLGTPLQHQPPDSGPTGNAAPAEQSRCTKQPDGASRQSRPRGEAHAIESWEGEGGAVF